MGAASPRRAGFRLGERGWQVVAAALAMAVYAPSLRHGWAYDDQMEVVLNTSIRSLALVPEMFTTTVWAGSGMETYLYRPLALLTYAVNHAISGLAPWSYHLVNVLLHGVVSVLVVRLGLLWRLPLAAAGIAGLLFAVHPIHVEAVASVVGRKDLLAGVFVLATLLAHRRGLDGGRGAGAGQGPDGGVSGVALPVLCYALAMLSKEIGVVALPLVLLQDLHLEEDRRAFFDRRRVLLMYLAYGATLVAYLLVRTAVIGSFGVADTSWYDNPLVAASLAVRLATAAWVVAMGVGLLLLPLNLSPDYSFNAIAPVVSVADPRLLAPLALVALVVWGLAHGTWRRGVAWGTGAYLVALLPVANVAVLTGTIFGERLLYLPSVAFCLAAGWGLHAVHRGAPRVRRAAAAFGVVAALALAGQTLRYEAAWSDDISLFIWATRAQPESTKAHHKLGEELLRSGRISEALPALDRALIIAPGNVYAQETLRTALQMAAADTLRGPALLRSFIDAVGSRHPMEVEWAREMLRRMEGRR